MKAQEFGTEIRIERIQQKEEKRRIARRVLQALPDWFGISEAKERYIRESEGQVFLAARQGEEAAGFLCLKETGDATVCPL